MSSIWAADIQEEAVKWAVPGLIPRGVVTTVCGPRSVGKTTMALRLLADGSRGLDPDGRTIPRLRSWVNTREDGVGSIIIPRFRAADGDLGKDESGWAWLAATARAWHLPHDLGKIRSRLEYAAANGFGFDLVMLDSAKAHMNVGNDREVVRALVGLHEMAAELNLAVLLIAHPVKDKARTFAEAIGGVSALQDESKAIFAAGKHPLLPGTYVLACERLGISQPPDAVLYTRTIHDTGRKDEHGHPVTVMSYDPAGRDTLTATEVYSAAVAKEQPVIADAVTRLSWWVTREVALARLALRLVDRKDLIRLAVTSGACTSAAAVNRAIRMAIEAGDIMDTDDGCLTVRIT